MTQSPENPMSRERLEAASNDLKDTTLSFSDFLSLHENTIQAALSFLLNPEPTEAMIDAYISERHAPFVQDTARCKFQAMMKELTK